MNYLISILISSIVALGVSVFNPPQIWDEVTNFGATNFPTSLDSFTNPGATDSVATVSHSAQHSNANDAIEAIEAKLGITASTPVANRVLYGDGTGSSIWSASPSLTSLTLSGQGLFGNFISLASSTIVGGLTITGNSTSTNATSTIGAFTNFATTTKLFGAGLSTCAGGNFLTWTGGSFSCEASAGGATIDNYYATSTSTDLPRTLSATLNDEIKIWATLQSNNCTSDGGPSLAIKYSIGAGATTTLDTATKTGDANPCSISAIGMITVPSTGLVHILVDSNNLGSSVQVSSLIEHDS